MKNPFSNLKFGDVLPLVGAALIAGGKLIEHKVDADKKVKEKEDLFKEFSERLSNSKQD